jgi:hypothetical protein
MSDMDGAASRDACCRVRGCNRFVHLCNQAVQQHNGQYNADFEDGEGAPSPRSVMGSDGASDPLPETSDADDIPGHMWSSEQYRRYLMSVAMHRAPALDVRSRMTLHAAL